MRASPLRPLGAYWNGWGSGFDRWFRNWFGFLAESGRSQGDGQESSSIHVASLALKKAERRERPDGKHRAR